MRGHATETCGPLIEVIPSGMSHRFRLSSVKTARSFGVYRSISKLGGADWRSTISSSLKLCDKVLQFEAPLAPDPPLGPEAPELPLAPEGPEGPEVPVASLASVAPDTSELPDAPDAPEGPVAVIAPLAPVTRRPAATAAAGRTRRARAARTSRGSARARAARDSPLHSDFVEKTESIREETTRL